MKSLVWEAPRQMALHDQEQPLPGTGEVLIKVAYAGICGSELSGYLGHNALRVPPLVMGHEFSGTIVATDAAATAEHPELTEGQHVTVNPMIYCGNCAHCAAGRYHLCANRTLIGAARPGAYAEYVSVPAKMVTLVPDDVSLRTASMTEPAAVAVRMGELAGVSAGEDVLIIGAGPVGLLALQVLRAQGAGRVFIADLGAERLAMAAELGGEPIDPRAQDVVQVVREATGGLGAAVSIDAVGTARTRAQCIAATRSAGTVMLTGLHEETSEMPVAEIIRREIVLQGSFCYTPANFTTALELLANGALHLDPWIVEAPLGEGGAWFDRLIDAPGDVAKVLLIPALD
ncbi:MAG TPA: galactitol-1-phosphate 5-dehydrogenase [Roseiflexaceae bacterium]|jgi:threonine dehydrogenase-like Zn-dependent dehydrogenase|nr:galactitol-1-phosphate 5-dehydrogenase [Roseiflexaceae bacterium]